MFPAGEEATEPFGCFSDSRPVFQPICGPEGAVHGVEALMRFYPSPIRGHQIFQSALPTEGVFDLARQQDWIMELDFYCREKILAEATRQSIQCLLFLNISPQSLLSDQHSVGRTDEMVERFGLKKDRLVLEITEETAIHDYELFARTVSHYRDQGYRIAIDDFGSGYAGLKMLASIRPDYLKIDRYFICDIHREPVKYSIVNALVDICHKLDIRMIAEGIETGPEFHSILNLGVQYRQGFYFGRPSLQIPDVPAALHSPGFTTEVVRRAF